MSHMNDVLGQLHALSIPFEEYHHEAAHTMEDCLKLPYAAPDVTFCKNILLCNRQKTEFYLYVTLPDKPFRTADVSKLIGVSRLSFAPHDVLPIMLGLESGSLSPFALWFDKDNQIHFVLDKDIFKDGRIAFHPCDNTATMIFTQTIFRDRVLPALEHKPMLLNVPWPQEDA